NPSYARGWYISGLLRLWAGQPDIAIEHLQASLRLSPRARVGPARLVIGAGHFFSRRFDEAVSNLLLAIQEDPSSPSSIATLRPAMRIWAGSKTRERSSHGCGLLPPACCRTPDSYATPNTASCCCPGCAWRWAKRHEPNPPS